MKKKDNLQETLDKIQKAYGKGSIMRMGDKPKIDVKTISTGSISLDRATIIGGVPKGRVVEIFGQESSGKTTLALHAIANEQASGGQAALIDAEHAFDPVYGEKLGIDVEALLISQPDTGEQALNIVDYLVRSNKVGLIVIDSVTALTPQTELEGEMGDSKMGVQARLMSQALRKLTPIVGVSDTCVMFINQLREKIGVVFGSPYVTTGGNALKYYSSMRLEIARKGQLKRGDDVYGHEARVKVVKNKLAPPFKQATFSIIYGEGISKESEIISLGIDAGVIKKSGSWYSYGETKLGQGEETVRLLLKDNKELADELLNKINKK